MNVVDVMIFGLGNRKAPYRVETIQCDHCNVCSFYKSGTCLRRTGIFADTRCMFGEKLQSENITTRSAKCSSFLARVKSNEKYGAIKRPQNETVIGVIGEHVVLRLSFASLREEKEGYHIEKSGKRYSIDNSLLNRPSFILKTDLEDLSERGLLYRLFTYTPLTLFNREPIKDYKNKELPRLVEGLKKYLPELASDFFKTYPQFDYAVTDFIGRKAYLNSFPVGSVFHKGNNDFRLADKETLVCDRYTDCFLPFGIKEASITVKLRGDEVVIIESNNQVNEDTKFMD